MVEKEDAKPVLSKHQLKKMKKPKREPKQRVGEENTRKNWVVELKRTSEAENGGESTIEQADVEESEEKRKDAVEEKKKEKKEKKEETVASPPIAVVPSPDIKSTDKKEIPVESKKGTQVQSKKESKTVKSKSVKEDSQIKQEEPTKTSQAVKNEPTGNPVVSKQLFRNLFDEILVRLFFLSFYGLSSQKYNNDSECTGNIPTEDGPVSYDHVYTAIHYLANDCGVVIPKEFFTDANIRRVVSEFMEGDDPLIRTRNKFVFGLRVFESVVNITEKQIEALEDQFDRMIEIIEAGEKKIAEKRTMKKSEIKEYSEIGVAITPNAKKKLRPRLIKAKHDLDMLSTWLNRAPTLLITNFDTLRRVFRKEDLPGDLQFVLKRASLLVAHKVNMLSFVNTFKDI